MASFLKPPSKRAGAGAVSTARFLTVSAAGYTDRMGVRPGGGATVLVGGSISKVSTTIDVEVSTGVSDSTVVSRRVEVSVMMTDGCEAVVVAISV